MGRSGIKGDAIYNGGRQTIVHEEDGQYFINILLNVYVKDNIQYISGLSLDFQLKQVISAKVVRPCLDFCPTQNVNHVSFNCKSVKYAHVYIHDMYLKPFLFLQIAKKGRDLAKHINTDRFNS